MLVLCNHEDMMMKWMLSCLMGFVWLGPLVAGAESGEDAGAPTGVAVAAIGEVSAEHMERVRSFVERNTSIEARLLEPQDATGESLSEILDSLAHLRTPEQACVVLLYAGDREFEDHTVYRYEAGVGIVNAGLMVTADEEVYLRRLEKLTMRSVGLLMGVEMVPNPQSAMWTYRSMSDLDAMGRNFDPPSLMRLREIARKQAIPLIKDSSLPLMEPRE